MLSKDFENGILKIDDDFLTELKSKHPPVAEIKQDSLLFGPINDLTHCYFHEIDEIMTAKAASRTKGAGGPFHLGTDQFRYMVLNKKFKTEAKPLTTHRLILLNKNLGVRPIGVGEVLRQIMRKAINCILKNNIQESAGRSLIFYEELI